MPEDASTTAIAGTPAVTEPTPGRATSEFWITLLVILVGALPTSGLIMPDSVWAKLIGLAGVVLAGLGYIGARTSLKRAHVLGSAGSSLSTGRRVCMHCGGPRP